MKLGHFLRLRTLLRGLIWSMLCYTTLVPGLGVGVEVGELAPAFHLEGAGGASGAPANRAGRVTVVHFWASWCKPCLRELPLLNEVAKRLEASGILFVGVSLDTVRHRAEALHKHLKLGFPLWFDVNSQTSSAFGPPTMPSTFIVDASGVVRFVHAGATETTPADVERDARSLLIAKPTAAEAPP